MQSFQQRLRHYYKKNMTILIQISMFSMGKYLYDRVMKWQYAKSKKSLQY